MQKIGYSDINKGNDEKGKWSSMCLITFAVQHHPNYPLIIVANRDEFYERSTAAATFWTEPPGILAGKDLLQGGSWMGVSTNGRFAAVTNYRDPSLSDANKQSRGEIVPQFLTSDLPVPQFLAKLQQQKQKYGGFNVLLFDGQQLQHFNNIVNDTTTIHAGIHSVSNHTLNTPWPKVQQAKRLLTQAINENNVAPEQLISLLTDTTVADDLKLPKTGVDITLERLLSPLFVKIPNYGTRSSTVLLIDQDKNVQFIERTYEQGEFAFDRSFNFTID